MQLNSKEETKGEDSKKEDDWKGDPNEQGPLMGFFACQPINECPHCIPGENIAHIKEFKDIKIDTPCAGCGNTKENWICLKCKEIGCSRYVNGCMVKHN